MRKFKGQDVINSARRLRIDVTEQDIKKGVRLDPENCAAAECIKRQTGAHAVSVHRGIVMIQKVEGGKYTRYKTSSSVRLEEIVFDRGGQFMPGPYDLEPVPVAWIAPKKRPKAPSAPKTKAKMKLAVRRRVIPGVRATARVTPHEGDDNV